MATGQTNDRATRNGANPHSWKQGGYVSHTLRREPQTCKSNDQNSWQKPGVAAGGLIATGPTPARPRRGSLHAPSISTWSVPGDPRARGPDRPPDHRPGPALPARVRADGRQVGASPTPDPRPLGNPEGLLASPDRRPRPPRKQARTGASAAFRPRPGDNLPPQQAAWRGGALRLCCQAGGEIHDPRTPNGVLPVAGSP